MLNLLYYSRMRYAIIADIHANLAAFSTVLADIEHKGGVDEIWCLGDIVGYGPDPHQCIELLRSFNHVCVAGNHDLAAIGKLDTSYFNPLAATACQWTATQLDAEDIKYLGSLPTMVEKGDFLLVHGSPMEPMFEYVISTGIAARSFAHFRSSFCLVGHSHIPAVFKEEGSSCLPVQFSTGIGLVLRESRMIINSGGVGQPRDGDPQTSYAVYDNQSRVIRLYRLPYDVKVTQDKMMRVGLPVPLATRLKEGR